MVNRIVLATAVSVKIEFRSRVVIRVQTNAKGALLLPIDEVGEKHNLLQRGNTVLIMFRTEQKPSVVRVDDFFGTSIIPKNVTHIMGEDISENEMNLLRTLEVDTHIALGQPLEI